MQLIILALILALQGTAFASSAELPSDLKEIGREAFYGDQSITAVTIPDGTVSIGELAFAYSGLEWIAIPSTVSSIPENAFDGVEELTIASPFNASAREYAFDHPGITWEGEVPITAETFPDSAFRNLVSSFDADTDGSLGPTEIRAVTEINCEKQGIADLSGIQFFPELTLLNCQNNQLENLDITHNTKLITLACRYNQLTELDVSHNPCLENLWCVSNALTELDVSQNSALVDLSCGLNQLASLDVSNNPGLVYLYFPGNQLTSINVSHNPALTELVCFENQLTELDVSDNPNLTTLNCRNNRIQTLDVTQNPALTFINCSTTPITSLNVQKCPALEVLEVNGCNLAELDVKSNRNLKDLGCWNNNLTSMDISQNSALVSVNLSANNSMTTLTTGSAQNLELLTVQNTELDRIDISGYPIIQQAYQLGERIEFYGNGNVVPAGEDSGTYGFYGYKLGAGLAPNAPMEIAHCNFCVSKGIVPSGIIVAP